MEDYLMSLANSLCPSEKRNAVILHSLGKDLGKVDRYVLENWTFSSQFSKFNNSIPQRQLSLTLCEEAKVSPANS